MKVASWVHVHTDVILHWINPWNFILINPMKMIKWAYNLSAVKWLSKFSCLVFLDISEPWPKTTISAHSPKICSIIPFCCHWYKRATVHKCNWSCIVSCWAYTDRNGYHVRESPCMPPQSVANSKRTVTIAMSEYRGTIWPHWKIWMRLEILFLTIECVNTVYDLYGVNHFCRTLLWSMFVVDSVVRRFTLTSETFWSPWTHSLTCQFIRNR